MQPVSLLLLFRLGKEAAFAPFPRFDILLAALHQLVAELEAQSLAVGASRRIKAGKGGIEERSEARIGIGIAGVRRCGQQHHVSLRPAGKCVEQVETLLLAAFAGADAGMGFVDDHEVRAFEGKIISALVGLDEIEADNGVRDRCRTGSRRWGDHAQVCWPCSP